MIWFCAFANPIFITRLERYASCAPRRPFQATSHGQKNVIFIVRTAKTSFRVRHGTSTLKIKIMLPAERENAILDVWANFQSDKSDGWKVNICTPMLGGKQINEFQTCCVWIFVFSEYCKSDVYYNTFCRARLVVVQVVVGSLCAANLIIIMQIRSKLRFEVECLRRIVKSSVSLDNMCVSRALRFH